MIAYICYLYYIIVIIEKFMRDTIRKSLPFIIAAILVIAILAPDIWHDLLLFLLVGAIPGSTTNVPPTTMIYILLAIAWCAIVPITVQLISRSKK